MTRHVSCAWQRVLCEYTDVSCRCVLLTLYRDESQTAGARGSRGPTVEPVEVVFCEEAHPRQLGSKEAL